MLGKLSLRHRLWRFLPAAPRRRLLARAAAFAAPRITVPIPVAREGIIVAGEFSRASGLGEGARLILRGLTSLGVPAWPLDIGPLLPAHTADLPPASNVDTPPAGAALALHVNPPLLPLALARLPRALIHNRRIVGIWVWELPVTPPHWRIGTRFVHDVWVPSQFAADALSPILQRRPKVVPYPLAILPPAPAPLGRADFGLSATAIVVLASFNLASSFERKNPFGAVAAFHAAFGDRIDRQLVLKVGNPHHFPADFARLAATVAGASNIRLETRTMPPAEALALTATADIVMSLHRSEGFGLVAAEAMLLGKPLIATGWSGNMQFMDAHSAALVRYELVAAEDPREVYAVRGAVWAEPEVAHAAELLRHLADDATARARLGAAGQMHARASLGATALADAVRALGDGTTV